MFNVDNSVIGLIIVSAISVFGISAFYFDFLHPSRNRSGDKHER
jgi:hypothetical protein